MLNNLLPLFVLSLAIVTPSDGLTRYDSEHPLSATRQSNEKWGGSATCTVKCADGACKFLKVDCNIAASYDDAKRQLQAKIEAEARAQGGKVEGDITFSIKLQF